MGECAVALERNKANDAERILAEMEDLKRRAESAGRENAQLKSQLDSFSSQRTEIGDTLLSARSLSRRMLDKARKQADEIVADANAQAEQILSDARAQAAAIRAAARADADQGEGQQERAVRCVEACISQLKEQQEQAIETLNAQWQAFLCSLGEDAPTAPGAPADLEDKVSAIAREMREIDKL